MMTRRGRPFFDAARFTARRKMRWLVLFALAALSGGVVAAGALSTTGPNAQLVNQNRLYGGGGTDPGCFVPDIGFCRQSSSDFSLDAHAHSHGNAAYGDIGGRGPVTAEVTCLAVHGHNAAVGGRIVSSPNPDRIGWVTLTYYIDNGQAQLDQVSPTYAGPNDPNGWPDGFPYRCPSPDVDTPAFGLFRSFLPISRGDIQIQQATEGNG